MILLSNRLIPSRFNQELSLQRREHLFIEKFVRNWWIVAHDADFTPCNFSRRITRNWWLVTRISLRVISAFGSRGIGGIGANDADSTPSDFNRPIERFNPDRPIAQFNPVRPISLFTPRRHHVGIHVGLRGPTMCLHPATSPPWVPHD